MCVTNSSAISQCNISVCVCVLGKYNFVMSIHAHRTCHQQMCHQYFYFNHSALFGCNIRREKIALLVKLLFVVI